MKSIIYLLFGYQSIQITLFPILQFGDFFSTLRNILKAFCLKRLEKLKPSAGKVKTRTERLWIAIRFPGFVCKKDSESSEGLLTVTLGLASNEVTSLGCCYCL